MDPLSITASAVGLLTFISNSSSSLNNFAQSCRTARSDIRHLLDEVSQISDILLMLKTYTCQLERDPQSTPLREHALSLLGRCAQTIRQAADLAAKYASSRAVALRWAINGKIEAEDIRKRLEGQKTTLTVILTSLSLFVGRDGVPADGEWLREHSASIFKKLNAGSIGGGLDDEDRRNIQAWLESVSVYAESVIGSDGGTSAMMRTLSRSQGSSLHQTTSVSNSRPTQRTASRNTILQKILPPQDESVQHGLEWLEKPPSPEPSLLYGDPRLLRRGGVVAPTFPLRPKSGFKKRAVSSGIPPVGGTPDPRLSHKEGLLDNSRPSPSAWRIVSCSVSWDMLGIVVLWSGGWECEYKAHVLEWDLFKERVASDSWRSRDRDKIYSLYANETRYFNQSVRMANRYVMVVQAACNKLEVWNLDDDSDEPELPLSFPEQEVLWEVGVLRSGHQFLAVAPGGKSVRIFAIDSQKTLPQQKRVHFLRWRGSVVAMAFATQEDTLVVQYNTQPGGAETCFEVHKFTKHGWEWTPAHSVRLNLATLNSVIQPDLQASLSAKGQSTLFYRNHESGVTIYNRDRPGRVSIVYFGRDDGNIGQVVLGEDGSRIVAVSPDGDCFCMAKYKKDGTCRYLNIVKGGETRRAPLASGMPENSRLSLSREGTVLIDWSRTDRLYSQLWKFIPS